MFGMGTGIASPLWSLAFYSKWFVQRALVTFWGEHADCRTEFNIAEGKHFVK